MPSPHVNGGSRLAVRRAAVPDRELPRLDVQVTRAQQREAHRQLSAVAVENVIAEEGVIRRVLHRCGLSQAAVETLDPCLAGGRDGASDELVAREGQDDVQLSAVGEERLRPEDVSAARERAVGIARRSAGDLGADACGDVALRLRWEAAGCVDGRDPVPAEVHDVRTGKHAEQVGVELLQFAHQAQLPACRRQSAVVTAVQARRAGQRVAGGDLVAEQERGLCLRRRRVIGDLPALTHHLTDIARLLCCTRPLARDQAQRRCIDARVIATGSLIYRLVEVAGSFR